MGLFLHLSALLDQGHCQESGKYLLYCSDYTAKGIVINTCIAFQLIQSAVKNKAVVKVLTCFFSDCFTYWMLSKSLVNTRKVRYKDRWIVYTEDTTPHN